jgi:hypothetical protein
MGKVVKGKTLKIYSFVPARRGVVEKSITFFSTKKEHHFYLKRASLLSEKSITFKTLGVLPYFYVRSRARNDEVNIIIF